MNGIGLAGWTYDAPRASRSDWFRLTDFDNYRTDSASPFPTMMQGDYIFGQASNGTKLLNIALASGHEGAPGSTDYIRLEDLNKSDANYSEWYAGVLIMTNATTFYLATSTTNVKGGTNIQFNTNNGMVLPAEGAHKAYVFLANKAFSVCSQGSIAISGLKLIPVTIEPVDINLITLTSALVVRCAIQNQKIAVMVTNKNASAVVITPVEFQRSSTGSDSNATTLTTIESLTAFTVPAGSGANPSVITKTYRAPIIGTTGYIRLVYKFKIGTGTTSANQTTPWTQIISAVG